MTTDVQGTIYTDTVWTLAESPYVVTGDVIVNPDITLTIEPGVKVAFESNLALYVNGTLIAKGTTSQPIYFTTNLDSPSLDDYWGMIDFRDTSENSVLQHAMVEYGGNATRAGDWCVSSALCVSTSSFTLDASTIQHNATRAAWYCANRMPLSATIPSPITPMKPSDCIPATMPLVPAGLPL